MKKFTTTVAVLAATTTLAQAGGLDRSNQNIGVIFEEGDYAELSFGFIRPSVSGTDLAAFGGRNTGDVAGSFTQVGLAYKQQINDEFSFALIVDQPFGADIAYPIGSSVALGGTVASVDTVALTGMARYEFGNGFSAHGGIRAQRLKGNLTLAGLAYGPVNGYSTTLSGDTAWGWQGGVAYERPDIALRVALTYFSEIDHDLGTTENILPGAVTNTSVTTPQSFNLDFQSGIAADTLLFGQIRWVDWSVVKVSPAAFAGATGGASLTDIEDETTFTLGVGRRFSDKFSGAVSIQYENGGADNLVSPLAPTNGKIGLTVGGTYTEGNMKITGGINYTKLNNAFAETGTPDVARANFSSNKAIGLGLKVGWSF